MSAQSINLTTLFLGRLRPPKQLTSTLCKYILSVTALLEPAEGGTKVCGQSGYQTRDLQLLSQKHHRLRYTTRRIIQELTPGMKGGKNGNVAPTDFVSIHLDIY